MKDQENNTQTASKYEGGSKAERIVNFTEDKCLLYTDKNNKAFAIIKDSPNPIAIPIQSKTMASAMKHDAYNNGEMLKKDDINEAQESLSAIAEYKGETVDIWQRNAPLKDEVGVEINLGGAASPRAVVTSEGVTVVESGSETLFSHSSTSAPLPIVADEGDWTKIFPYLNMIKEHMLLLVAYLTYILAHPKQEHVGYPIFVIKGEQGSGKSFLCKAIIRAFIDPSTYGIQMFPSSPREMAISAKNSFVLIYDNIRKLCHKWSDALCVAATGGFLPGRKMYTDDEEVNIDLHGPKILNGIHNFITESDAVSRCINIQLLPIPTNTRKNERELTDQLTLDKPVIFRGLLDIISRCFAVEGQETITHPQRMMGFVHWLAKFELAEGLEVGSLQKVYAENQQQAMLDTIAEDALAYAILNLANEYNNGDMWSGTPTELLTELSKRVSAQVSRHANTWPQNAISLSKRLAALKPSLAAQSVEIINERGKERRIKVGMLPLEMDLQTPNAVDVETQIDVELAPQIDVPAKDEAKKRIRLPPRRRIRANKNKVTSSNEQSDTPTKSISEEEDDTYVQPAKLDIVEDESIEERKKRLKKLRIQRSQERKARKDNHEVG